MQTKENTKTTPMMEQFFAIKAEHKDALLFFRMGDFYELFFDDAKKAVESLGISLTKRGKHNGKDIPMCGVPIKSHEAYLSKLIRCGHKVAVCEQTEDPEEAKKRGYKAIVNRDVVRLVTSGTLTEDNLLDSRKNNFLVCINELRDEISVAWVDISTGSFEVQSFNDKRNINLISLSACLARLNPSEIIFSHKALEDEKLKQILYEYKSLLSPLPSSRFNSDNARINLEKTFKIKALDAFGEFSRCDISATGSLLDYINLTQKGSMPRLSRPQKIKNNSIMEIDQATRKNLELTRPISGEKSGKSLLSVIDKTITSFGSRLLASRISSPLTQVEKIKKRLDMVEFFVNNPDIREDLRKRLKSCPDIQRALSRVSLGRCSPRDLSYIEKGLSVIPLIKDDIKGSPSKEVFANRPESVDICLLKLGSHEDLTQKLKSALKEELPISIKDGDFIKKGYSSKLDELRKLNSQSEEIIKDLTQKYAKETGIEKLKIKYNKVLGRFIETTAKQGEKLINNPEYKQFIHRQTLSNAIRFSTFELGELEEKIEKSKEQAIKTEKEIFDELCDDILAVSDEINIASQALAEFDVSSSLGELAQEKNYSRPVIDESLSFEIKGGRHPVVEQAIEEEKSGSFVANDCTLGGKDKKNKRLWLLTGPNMAGKSTFLRQNALIAIMAQMGAFVPADYAKIGVINRLFSRVGASDDLARGRSTFMVEMVETAAILNQSDKRALVILDEIGRGTATYDGLSIAWAVVENLHEVNKCRALFATHYHELTALSSKLKNLSLKTIKVKEWNEDIIFLHEVISGTADRSYGIHVAKIAGLPKTVIKRAEEVLDSLENSKENQSATKIVDDLPLFQSVIKEVEEEENKQLTKKSKAVEELEKINPDELTPKKALDILYHLKELEKQDNE